jgi:Argininosuccinate lyase
VWKCRFLHSARSRNDQVLTDLKLLDEKIYN